MRTWILLLAAILLLGCKSSSGPLSAKLGQEFSMKVGQQITLEDGWDVLSVESVEDSRCPVGLMCFMAGSARVSCKLSEVPFALSIYNQAVDTLLCGYHVELTSVEPWPTIQQTPAQEDYVIKFIVTRDYRMWKRTTALTMASHVRGLK